MTGLRINENGGARYIKIPASTSDMWAAKEPLDAGTMMILENNINHCSVESCKQLFTTLNGTVLINQDNPPDNNLFDTPTTTDTNPLNDISWSKRTAYRFGPFLSPFDARSLMLKIQIYNTGTTNLYTGITYDSFPPTYTDDYRFELITLTDIGETIQTSILQPSTVFILDPNFEPVNSFLTDSINGNAANEIQKFFYYVWVGVLVDNSSSNIVSISGFEIRE